MQYLTLWDVVLTPLYLLILILIARWYRDKHYPNGHPLRKLFLQGLYLKFFGAIFIGLVYQFYYGTGDTYEFFTHAKIINSSLSDSPLLWSKLMLNLSPAFDPYIYKYASQLNWYNDPSSYTVSRIVALFGLLNGTTYLPIALLFAFFSYTGIWAMYVSFVNIYPYLYKKLAIAFLFIPSTFVWGSGVFKDSVCMFALGWMIHTTFRIFINKDLSLKNFILLIFSFYLVAIIKIYILLSFLPGVFLWLLLTYSTKIKTLALRWAINVFCIAISLAGFFFVSGQFAKELNIYSLDNIASTSAKTRGWIKYASGDEGSAYDLGEFDPSIAGMASKLPAAVAVTLYRPFLWESKKVIVLFSALEALVFTYFTVLVFVRRRWKAFSLLFSDPNILFCFIFTLIFAFAVGISSYNFGALSRYKIPCLPFYGTLLILLLYKDDEKLKKRFILKKKKAVVV